MSTHLPDCAKRAVLLFVIVPCLGVTIQREQEHIPIKTKIELSPIQIQSNLNNLVEIAVPIIKERSLYRLHKPNGDTIKFNVTRKSLRTKGSYNNKPINIKYTNISTPIIQQLNKYKLVSTLVDEIYSAEYADDNYDITMGPLQEEDGGKWVLSVYIKNSDDNWTELFQVISIFITEATPLNHKRQSTFYIGDTINVSFAYPLKNIVSCELIAPRTTFDRFLSRNNDINYNNCGFTISKLTEKDKGAWVVTGVANNHISYQGELVLKVKKRFDRKRWRG